MKVIFTEDEINSLPDDARERLGDDLEIEVETLSELSEEFEDVSGLKKALNREREARRKSEKDHKADKARLTLTEGDEVALAERDAEIEALKATIAERDTSISDLETSIKTKDQDIRINEALSKHKGDADLLRPHIRAMLESNPETDLDEAMPALKEKHPGAFAAQSTHSGGGSDPQHGGDNTFGRSRISSMPTRRSEMSERQKVDYQKEHGLDQFMDLPL